MKKNLLITISVVALAGLALASSPTYKTMSANGLTATPANLIFPADPTTQIRIVNVAYTTDTNNAVLSFSGGSTAFYITGTNLLSSSVTNQLNSTNGLIASAGIVLQHAGTNCYSTVSKWNCSTNDGQSAGTNVVLASGGWGVLTTPGDGVYIMDTAITIPATATGSINGEAIYVAALPGRPVRVLLTPTETTNQLNAVTAHYD